MYTKVSGPMLTSCDQPHLIICLLLNLLLHLGGCNIDVHFWSHIDREWKMGGSPKKKNQRKVWDAGEQRQQYLCCSLTSLSLNLSYFLILGCVLILIWSLLIQVLLLAYSPWLAEKLFSGFPPHPSVAALSFNPELHILTLTPTSFPPSREKSSPDQLLASSTVLFRDPILMEIFLFTPAFMFFSFFHPDCWVPTSL